MIFEDAPKLAAATILCRQFDFSIFSKIGDIGGVPFSQAWIIHQFFPDIKFILTDYDEKSLEKHKKIVPFGKGERVEKFCAKKDKLNIFSDCDLLTMWGVDYALEDNDLIRIFEYVKNTNKTLLMATVDVGASFNFRKLKSFVKGYFLNSRLHGLLRSEKYFMHMSRSLDMDCKVLISTNGYRIFEIK